MMGGSKVIQIIYIWPRFNSILFIYISSIYFNKLDHLSHDHHYHLQNNKRSIAFLFVFSQRKFMSNLMVIMEIFFLKTFNHQMNMHDNNTSIFVVKPITIAGLLILLEITGLVWLVWFSLVLDAKLSNKLSNPLGCRKA